MSVQMHYILNLKYPYIYMYSSYGSEHSEQEYSLWFNLYMIYFLSYSLLMNSPHNHNTGNTE